MAKWLLHSYLQVALNVHSARTPSLDIVKVFVETKIIEVFKYDLQKGAEKLGEKKSEE